jgi:hypothetical protein
MNNSKLLGGETSSPIPGSDSRTLRHLFRQKSTKRTDVEILALMLPIWAIKFLLENASLMAQIKGFGWFLLTIIVAPVIIGFVAAKLRFSIDPAVADRSWAGCRIFVVALSLLFLFYGVVVIDSLVVLLRLWWCWFLSSLLPLAAIVLWYWAPVSTHKELSTSKAILATVSCLIAIVLLELGVRLVEGPLPKGMPSVTSADRMYWYFKPRSLSTAFGVAHNFNSWGFRGPEPELSDPESIRIIVLGDSIPFGGGVPEDQIFPRRAETLLNKSGRLRKRIVVVNASIPGYSTEQIKIFYEKHLRDLPHDIMIFCHYIDDINREPHYKVNDYLYTPCWPSRTQDVFYRSNIARHLMEIAGFSQNFFINFRRFSYDETWPQARGIIEQLGRLTRRRGAVYAIYNIPRFDWKGVLGNPNRYYHAPKNGQLETWCRSRAVPYRDLLPALADKDIAAYRMSESDLHFNEKGHALVSRDFADFIEEVVCTVDPDAVRKPTGKEEKSKASGPRSRIDGIMPTPGSCGVLTKPSPLGNGNDMSMPRGMGVVVRGAGSNPSRMSERPVAAFVARSGFLRGVLLHVVRLPEFEGDIP